MRASVDIGTNSTRLLVAEYQSGQWRTVMRQTTITRLGQGVDQSGRLDEEAIKRTVTTLQSYKQILSSYPIDSLTVMATSAVRDGTNRDEFLEKVQESTSWDVVVLSGEEEARLSFLGAVKALSNDTNGDRQVLVVDIGGGSTELILGTRSGTILEGGSVQVGAVRMTELFVSGHPIDPNELVSMDADVNNRLRRLIRRLPVQEPILVGVGGTATTLAALHLSLSPYREETVNGERLTIQVVEKMYARLCRLSLDERLALPGMQKGREDVIPAGVGILLQVMQLLPISELIVSDSDLLQGVLYAQPNI